ncbi:FAD binding domain-containing protein [Paenibacillus alginolyticus]|uniref:FAD binding domain-containing protein n=1 Tax=Paenibacillus alginolyticus TaxID=59839 RepID=A0ABT4GMT1_9BACL|nr:FAD binding domain-containing protein [Paenibacillus alginolyticus]MCY9667315.1 FAD binding domain-containing protein [Paenibacillus alginolyticus]MCY9697528.1 FAD binding domain-containing protein [Paenibacillus alginolyticus]MEC0141994.1 FAD binding domain-containing protein [Paenibacillus alginolyticus]
MISFDFEYYTPTTVEEAVRIFQQADSNGKEPLYYSGGTEIISMARLNQLRTGAVIDIKGIPACNVLQIQQEQLVIGAAITLTALSEANLFPLLGETVRDAADHTNRNKITVGGNLCGKFIYREALLPFLLADSQLVLAGTKGIRHVPVHEILNGEPRLEKGELLVQILSDRRYLDLPFVTVKKTKMEKIDYPIVRISGLKTKEGIRVAFSGVSAVPIRSLIIEEVLNDSAIPLEERIESAIRLWPVPILNDILSSKGYRTFVLRNTLFDTMSALERRRV